VVRSILKARSPAVRPDSIAEASSVFDAPRRSARRTRADLDGDRRDAGGLRRVGVADRALAGLDGLDDAEVFSAASPTTPAGHPRPNPGPDILAFADR
jgi:hypothetical protein